MHVLGLHAQLAVRRRREQRAHLDTRKGSRTRTKEEEEEEEEAAAAAEEAAEEEAAAAAVAVTRGIIGGLNPARMTYGEVWSGGQLKGGTWVTTGPSVVQTTMDAPLSRWPFTKITSTVQPKPSITFTSSTVHCSVAQKLKCWARRCCDKRASMWSRSFTPSPLMADVGTRDTVDASSLFSQYSSAFRPFSISCTRTPFMRWWNSSCVA